MADVFWEKTKMAPAHAWSNKENPFVHSFIHYRWLKKFNWQIYDRNDLYWRKILMNLVHWFFFKDSIEKIELQIDPPAQIRFRPTYWLSAGFKYLNIWHFAIDWTAQSHFIKAHQRLKYIWSNFWQIISKIVLNHTYKQMSDKSSNTFECTKTKET